ncbi:MAG: hypothetical protein JNN15_06545 [Blastocatellia bacterium]|nr:hypothetical protein [Blastocatellia bacterium]
MIVVMKQSATEEQISRVVKHLLDLGFDPYRSTGKVQTILAAIGERPFDKNDLELFDGVQEVVRISLPYKLASRNSKPENTVIKVKDIELGGSGIAITVRVVASNSFHQVEQIYTRLAQEGVKLATVTLSEKQPSEKQLKEYRAVADSLGLLLVARPKSLQEVAKACHYCDILEVGTLSNRLFLEEASKADKPLIVSRLPSMSIEEVLVLAESVLSLGIEKVIICEQGVRMLDPLIAQSLDISAITAIKRLSHLPVFADPCAAMGRRDRVAPMALAAAVGGVDGLVFDILASNEQYGTPQALTFTQFLELLQQLRLIVSAIGRRLL